MRVNQCRVSKSVQTFKSEYLKKFNLIDAFDTHNPVLIIGMYDDNDYKAFQRFKGKIIVLWCGTDTLMINPVRLNILKSKIAIHVVKSRCQSIDLTKLNIPNKIVPVSWQSFSINPVPRGTKIYHYGIGSAYGEHLLPEIERRTGLEIIKTTHNTYKRDKLFEIYKECFIGLRLTKHDGLPNTVIELGMMGRRCIYNGDLPNAITWNNVNDVVNSILHEYENRSLPDLWNISNAVKEHIDINDNWLNV